MRMEKITFDKRNYRRHDEKNKRVIRKSLEELGAGRSVVIDKEGALIAGNGVYEQAQKLKMPVRVVETDGSELVVVKRTDLATGDEKRKRLALADNVASDLSDFDNDLLQEDFTIDELGDWGLEFGQDNEPTVQEDDFDEERDTVSDICKKGDVWQLGVHRLMCGDSTSSEDVAVLMDGEQANMLLTDPPYNVNYGSKDGRDIENDNFTKDEEFQNFVTSALANANVYLSAGGAFYIWTTQGHAMYDITKAADAAGLTFRQQLIWNKNHLVLGRMDYQGKHEPCLYGWKHGAGHYFTSDRAQTTVYEDEVEIDKLKKEEMRKMLHDILDSKIPTTVINCDKPNESKEHPTMKPIKLMAMCIKNSSKLGWLVLDLFGGSGSTLIACDQLKRKCYMMELDTHYCDVIIARWEKLTGKKAIKIKKL